MDAAVLQEEIDEISVMMYQNREQEVLEKFGDVSEKLNQLVNALLSTKEGNGQEMDSFIIHMYQTLNQAYRHKDMLGMADCLQKYATLAIELYKMKC